MNKTILAAAAVLTLVLSGCEPKSPTEGLTLRLEFQNATTQAALLVVDAATGSLLEGVPVTVTISGAASDRVVDGSGTAVTTFSGTSGAIAFGLKDPVPTSALPVELLVRVAAEGYLTTSEPLVIADSSAEPLTIDLVSLATTPTGVTAASATFTTEADGSFAADQTLETEPGAAGQASVTVPAGAIARDADGAALTGSISTDVVYFNPQEDQSLQSFPGGFSVETPDADPGAFVTAGFVAVEMVDEAGREADTFSDPITVTINVDGSTINPLSGVAVADGDTIPSWSYEEAEGEWTYEGRTTLSGPNADGTYTGVFEAAHLSYWNLDWHYPGKCGVAEPIVLNGFVEGTMYRGVLTNTQTGQYFREVRGGQDGEFTFRNAPSTIPLTFTVYAGLTAAPAGSVALENLCAGGFIELAPPVNTVTVSVNVRGVCPDLEIRPTAPIYMRPVELDEFMFVGYMRNGQLSVGGVVPDQEYEVLAYLWADGELHTGSSLYQADRDGTEFDGDIELPDDFCT